MSAAACTLLSLVLVALVIWTIDDVLRRIGRATSETERLP